MSRFILVSKMSQDARGGGGEKRDKSDPQGLGDFVEAC